MVVNGSEQRMIQILNQGYYREPYHLRSYVPILWAHCIISLKIKSILKRVSYHFIVVLAELYIWS